MDIGTIFQILTGILGALAIFVVGRKSRVCRWGFVIGLVSQPFWAATYVLYGQYLLLPPLALYTWSWWQGYRNHWKKGELLKVLDVHKMLPPYK